MVTMGTPEDNAAFKRSFNLSYTLLSDPDRIAYQAYGVPRGSGWNVAGPSTWIQGFRALGSHGFGKIIGDPFQLPGSFIIDKIGVIQFAQYNKTSAGWATPAELLKVFRTLPN